MESGIYRFPDSNSIFLDPVRMLNRNYSQFRVSPSHHYSRFFTSKFDPQTTKDDELEKTRVSTNCRKRKRNPKKNNNHHYALNEKEIIAEQRHQIVYSSYSTRLPRRTGHENKWVWYFLVRPGESQFESLGVINTNPVTKTSIDSGLSENGKKETVRAAFELKKMGACEGSCWIWPSITQRAYQAAEIIATVNTMDRRAMATDDATKPADEEVNKFDLFEDDDEFEEFDVDIESHKGGVIVLVTGCLTGKDKLRKKFAQSFFLAPQAKGYFVLNDVFRYIDETEPFETNSAAMKKADDSGVAQSLAETEVIHTPAADMPDVTTSNENDQVPVKKSFEMSEEQGQIGAEKEIPAIPQSNQSHNAILAESSHTSAREDGPKNSYASIVKKAKGSPKSMFPLIK